ncbi:MAG: thermonuclease family protein [Myxococcota bacterium]
MRQRPETKRIAWLLLGLLACQPAALLAGPALAAGERVIEGRVVRVIDGDDLEVRHDGRTTRVRLSGVDAPESGQPWGRRARQALSERTFGKPVRVIDVDARTYGRTVGEVYADDVCVGCELVREGHAWVYRRYTDDPVLLRLEAEARENRRGLWGLPPSERIPPWEWRRGVREPAPDPSRDDAPFRCGAKRYCQEMRSCAEARFHLVECGLTRIDGDGDGVPCEKLCTD